MANMFRFDLPEYKSPYPKPQNLLNVAEMLPQMQLNQAKAGLIQEEISRRNAFREAASTGDMEGMLKADPELGLKLSQGLAAQRKTQHDLIIEQMKNGSEYLKNNIGGVTLQNYESLIDQADKMFPMLGVRKIAPLVDSFGGDPRKLQAWKDDWLHRNTILQEEIKMRTPTTVLDASGRPVSTVYGGKTTVLPQPRQGPTPQRYVPEKGEGSGIWVTPGVHDVPQGYIPEKQKIQQGAELDLTPQSIDAMARRYILDGTIPGLGLGKAATKARSMVMNRVPEIMAEEGLTPQGVVANKVVLGGLQSEVKRLLGQRGPMLAFANTADRNLDIALNLSERVGRTGAPVFDRWVLAGRKQIAGDPEVASFDAAVRVAINEFAKVTSSATGGGVTSDQSRKEIEGILATALNPAQFKAVVQTLRADMKNRVDSYDIQLNNTQESAKKLGTPGTGGGLPGQIIEPPKPKQSIGFRGPGKYRGPDKNPIEIRTIEEYQRIFGQ